MEPKIWIGFAGWTFPAWRKTFYPKGLPQKQELEYASNQVNSLEVNGTFYSLQTPETFERWYSQTPSGFRFSIKAPRFITHIRRLKEIDRSLAVFLASGLFRLREKLGPILWQFPPNFMLKDDRVQKFLEILPQKSDEIESLVKRTEAQVKELPQKRIELRHAFEFRHPSFDTKEVRELFFKHNVAFVLAHSGPKSYPYVEEPTANFIYARLHGEEKKFAKGYTKKAIEQWAVRIEKWKKEGRLSDIHIYFDNAKKERAPFHAVELSKQVGLKQ